MMASRPFRRHDIRPCAICERGVAHDGNILIWRISFERLGLDRRAIERQHGLELIVGSPAIAHVLGSDAELAKPVDGPHDVLVCEPCVTDLLMGLFVIAEKRNRVPAPDSTGSAS